MNRLSLNMLTFNFSKALTEGLGSTGSKQLQITVR
ncbi:hypothetical protein BvCmsKSNP093_01752 [Escherichia coli]|nr:hypothetical protein C3988_01252 [Escherichia coli]GCL89184.1 hypothetical protein BvCms454_04245 [Escherichia coli]GCN09028.1 hypothetical protein ExPECSC004_02103 [Escherichia coli]GDJ91270.1 hypothetical protein BvCmsKSNP079_03762 [Escherichia coli]GDK94248.1 hypothetical protein BvCmsKSNP093_01752 [Escherichia coli]